MRASNFGTCLTQPWKWASCLFNQSSPTTALRGLQQRVSSNKCFLKTTLQRLWYPVSCTAMAICILSRCRCWPTSLIWTEALQ
ncbi:hypothetical protein BC939DRAFT_454731 [Gamsiella multidivaricata]|uniref:uncharacterized protein n=1 Tax=Gamsiella multidivaricata TaxID=101098 RepID=UPI002220DF47|nr:uncharacterized protein BC939DRAFT_454731 [Gamsiella multidivaricata]KAI7821869.1 hypothetical protein BC939DRAFT_454731 [Gamsiella multidivaricata]